MGVIIIISIIIDIVAGGDVAHITRIAMVKVVVGLIFVGIIAGCIFAVGRVAFIVRVLAFFRFI